MQFLPSVDGGNNVKIRVEKHSPREDNYVSLQNSFVRFEVTQNVALLGFNLSLRCTGGNNINVRTNAQTRVAVKKVSWYVVKPTRSLEYQHSVAGQILT